MNYFKKASFILNGDNLLCSSENHVDIYLKRKSFQIIKGTVYDQNHQPCNGAAVQVIEINGKDHTRNLLGYTFTDENGHYVFSLEAKPCMKYELAIFASLFN